MRFLSGFRFRFRLIPLVATILVTALGVALGQWQLNRADAKRAIAVKLVQRAEAPPLSVESLADVSASDLVNLEYRKVRLRGEFVPAWPLYLDNRPQQGRAGLYVLMPFRPAGSSRPVMVQRGWVARNPQDRARLPRLDTPAGMIDLEGTLLHAPGRVMQLGTVAPLQPAAIVQNLDLGELARASGLPVQGYLVQQTSDLPDGLVREWPLPSTGIDRHLGYAFQWYALALMACVFYVVTGFKRGKSGND